MALGLGGTSYLSLTLLGLHVLVSTLIGQGRPPIGLMALLSGLTILGKIVGVPSEIGAPRLLCSEKISWEGRPFPGS